MSQRALALGLVLAVTTFAFDALSFTAAMPAVVDDLGGIGLYGVAFSAFMLANLFSLVIAGTQADRHGPGRVLTAGLVCFAVGLVIGGTAVSMPVIVLGRAVQGLGGGAIGSSAYVVIARGFPSEARARMFALLSAAWILPALVAPGVAGVVAQQLSWRLVFLGLLPFPVVAAALALPAIHKLGPVEHIGEHPSIRPRVVAALRLSLGTALVVAGTQAEAVPLALAAVATGVAVAAPALRLLLPAGTLVARPVLPALVAVRALANWAFFGTDAFVPLALTGARGRGTLLAGLALTTSSLTWSCAAWAQARLATRVPARTMVRAGVALIGTGIAITALVLVDSMPIAVAFVGWSIAGGGMGLAFNTTSVAALDEAPAGREGTTGSTLQLADALGVALSTGIGGAIVGFGTRAGWSTAHELALVFGVTVAGAVVAIFAAGRLPAGTRAVSVSAG